MGKPGWAGFFRFSHRPDFHLEAFGNLTPARIAGWDKEIGSIVSGKRADLLVLDKDLQVKEVYVDGERQKL